MQNPDLPRQCNAHHAQHEQPDPKRGQRATHAIETGLQDLRKFIRVAPRGLPGAQSRNFVLCPGKAYDRSPCGTGTSAKLSCLAADGKLLEGDVWIQESLIGSTFEATYRWHDRSKGEIVPIITGTAYVTGENLLHLDADDPFRWGIRA